MIRKWLEEYSVITMYINFQRRSCDGVSLVMVSLQNIERPFFSLKAYSFKLCNVVMSECNRYKGQKRKTNKQRTVTRRCFYIDALYKLKV